MSTEQRAEILTTITRLVREVIDDTDGLGPPIGLETTFNRDLELESIEFVTLAEKITERYGEGVDFAGWLAGMELDQILSLTVGDLVEHVVKCL